MKRNLFSQFVPAVAVCLTVGTAQAQNTADATLELTVTLTDVTITDEFDNTRQAVFENTFNTVGDLTLDDFGPNGSVGTGERPGNPPGSVGSAFAEEVILLDGLDPFDNSFTLDEFDIGSSFTSTMDVATSATTPGSLFFAQVDSENTFFFSGFTGPNESFTFFFDFTVELTGMLNGTFAPGRTLATSSGDSVEGFVDSTGATGDSIGFLADAFFFDLAEFNEDQVLVPLNDQASGSFEVAFEPGDSGLSISIFSGITANAEVAIPEPASLALVGIGATLLVGRGRRTPAA